MEEGANRKCSGEKWENINVTILIGFEIRAWRLWDAFGSKDEKS
jgi:hypothetical protein